MDQNFLYGFLSAIFLITFFDWYSTKKKTKNIFDYLKVRHGYEGKIYAENGLKYLKSIEQEIKKETVEMNIFYPRHIFQYLKSCKYHDLSESIQKELFRIDSDTRNDLKIDGLERFTIKYVESDDASRDINWLTLDRNKIHKKVKPIVNYIKEEKNQYSSFFKSGFCIYDNSFFYNDSLFESNKTDSYLIQLICFDFLVSKLEEMSGNDFVIKQLREMQEILFAKRLITENFSEEVRNMFPQKWEI